MNTHIENYADDYCAYAKTLAEFQDEITKNEQTGLWRSGIVSKHIRIHSASGPMDAAQLAQTCHVPLEVAYDTCESGTRLYITVGGETFLLRDTVFPSLLSRCRVNGAGLSDLRKQIPDAYVTVLNHLLEVSKGSAIIMYRNGKVGAIMSDNGNGYEIMSIRELVDITEAELTARFGKLSLISGTNEHSFSTCLLEMPDAQGDLLAKYKNAVGKMGLRGVNFMPCVRFSTSDTTMSCARIAPLFRTKDGGLIPFGVAIGVKHERGLNSQLTIYRDAVKQIYAKFEESAKLFGDMATTMLEYPIAALIGMCDKVGITKKLSAEAASDLAKLMSTGRCTMHDVYLSIAEISFYAQRDQLTMMRQMELEEAISRVVLLKWTDFDIPRDVSVYLPQTNAVA